MFKSCKLNLNLKADKDKSSRGSRNLFIKSFQKERKSLELKVVNKNGGALPRKMLFPANFLMKSNGVIVSLS